VSGHRTLRFLLDKLVVTQWGGIEDIETSRDGGAVAPAQSEASSTPAETESVGSDQAWVAGVTLTRGAQIRIVTPQGPELYCDESMPHKVVSGPAACCARPR
jgi:hypothetical protein